MKPGYKTSEFWLAVAADAVGALMASGVLGDGGTVAKVVGFAGSVLATMGYVACRSWVKKK